MVSAMLIIYLLLLAVVSSNSQEVPFAGWASFTPDGSMYEGAPELDKKLEDACEQHFPGSIPANTDTITSNIITGLPDTVPDQHVIAPACSGNQPGINCADSDYRWGLDVGTSLTQISSSSLKKMHLHRAYPGQGFALCVADSPATTTTTTTPTTATPDAERYTCDFVPGDGIAVGPSEGGSYTEQGCVAFCVENKKTDGSINGIAYSADGRNECFCYRNMHSIRADINWKTCYLVPTTTTTTTTTPTTTTTDAATTTTTTTATTTTTTPTTATLDATTPSDTITTAVTTTTETTDGPAFTVVCHQLRVTGIWRKEIFGSSHVVISLNEPSCNGYMENRTHLWVDVNFSECGSTNLEDGDVILQQNTAFVTISDVISKVIDRSQEHYYTMTCKFDRSLNVSFAVGFNATRARAGYFNSSDVTSFNASIAIYDSSSFLKVSTNPVTVTLTEPIFIGIRDDDNNENFKFIVNQCYATPTADGHSDMKYLFFGMKCPIDPTFEIISSSNNHFDFRIKAFTFIEISGSVFIHCNLYVCLVNSTAPACQQTCHVRQRRAITRELGDEALPLEEVGVTTGRIVFEKKTLCDEKACPPNSQCLELYPASCRCDEGYVIDEGTGTCHSERVLPIFGLHIEMVFISTYADPTSTDFLKLATDIENQLMTLFRYRDKRIVGVKIIRAWKGSVVLDLLIIYANTTRKEDAFRTFVRHVMANDTEMSQIPKDKILDIKVKTEILPTIEKQSTLVKQPALEKQPDQDRITIGINPLLLVATSLPVILIIIAIVVVLGVKRAQSRRKGDKDVQGIDNNGVSMENLG